MELRSGASFDRYTIEAALGVGGMGAVYRAYDPRLHRRVAIKILLPGASDAARNDAPTIVSRVLREARAAAAFDHPNAVSIYDVGEADGAPFIAMELVEGTSLRAYVGDPSVPVAARIKWLVEVARVLAAAHEQGLVHRDIKPDNVMVRPDGVAKVLDFGIARRAPEAGDAVDVGALAAHSPVATLTEGGAVVGTPRYMAPEQLQGGPIDGRADQFSWGVLAFELLSGRPPSGPADAPIGAADPDSIPSLAVPEGELPAAVDATVRKALRRAARERFDSMHDVVAALEPFAAWSPRAPTSSPAMGAASTADTMKLEGVPTFTARPTARPAPTRTTPAPALRLGRRGVAVAALGVSALAVAFALGARARHAPRPGAAATPGSAPTTMLELAAPETTRADARAAYASGMQALHDASILAGIEGLTRAVALDPSLGAAEVRLVLWTNSASEERAHLQAALGLRAALSDRDRLVLSAEEPYALLDPPDVTEAVRRVELARARYPLDAELALVHGRMLFYAGRYDDADRAFDRALELDPSFALAVWAKAATAEQRNEPAAALTLYARCLDIAASAAACLRSQAAIFAAQGQCAELEGAARRLVAMEPAAPRSYLHLARALAALGRPIAAVRSALAQSWPLYPETERPRREVGDRMALAELTGDFEAAGREAARLEELVADAPSEEAHAWAQASAARIRAEVGDAADAGRIGARFLETRSAWVASWQQREVELYGAASAPVLLAFSRRAGLTSPQAAAQIRQDWTARARAASPMAARELWYAAFAEPAETADEAQEALEAMSTYGPLLPTTSRVPHDAATGRVLLLAGRASEALPWLARGVASCTALDAPIEHTRGAYFRGRALEATGATGEACAAYRVVLDRWGAAVPRSVTADLAKARSRALSCESASEYRTENRPERSKP